MTGRKALAGTGWEKGRLKTGVERVSLKNRISRFSDDLVSTCNLPPLPSGGRGLGRGRLLGLYEFAFTLNPQSHPHPSLPLSDGGSDKLPLQQIVAWASPTTFPPEHPNLIISVYSWVEPMLRAAGSPAWLERSALQFARI